MWGCDQHLRTKRPQSAQKANRRAPRHLNVRSATSDRRGIFLRRPMLWGLQLQSKLEKTSKNFKRNPSKRCQDMQLINTTNKPYTRATQSDDTEMA